MFSSPLSSPVGSRPTISAIGSVLIPLLSQVPRRSFHPLPPPCKLRRSHSASSRQASRYTVSLRAYERRRRKAWRLGKRSYECVNACSFFVLSPQAEHDEPPDADLVLLVCRIWTSFTSSSSLTAVSLPSSVQRSTQSTPPTCTSSSQPSIRPRPLLHSRPPRQHLHLLSLPPASRCLRRQSPSREKRPSPTPPPNPGSPSASRASTLAASSTPTSPSSRLPRPPLPPLRATEQPTKKGEWASSYFLRDEKRSTVSRRRRRGSRTACSRDEEVRAEDSEGCGRR